MVNYPLSKTSGIAVVNISKCHFLASIGGDTNKVNQCPKCKSIMINTHITKDEWDAKTKEEKIASVKKAQRLVTERNAANVNNAALLTEISNVNNNIKAMNTNLVTIKNILMFYFVLSIIGIVGMVITFLNSI